MAAYLNPLAITLTDSNSSASSSTSDTASFQVKVSGDYIFTQAIPSSLTFGSNEAQDWLY